MKEKNSSGPLTEFQLGSFRQRENEDAHSLVDLGAEKQQIKGGGKRNIDRGQMLQTSRHEHRHMGDAGEWWPQNPDLAPSG